jgi:hypothetical protein
MAMLAPPSLDCLFSVELSLRGRRTLPCSPTLSEDRCLTALPLPAEYGRAFLCPPERPFNHNPPCLGKRGQEGSLAALRQRTASPLNYFIKQCQPMKETSIITVTQILEVRAQRMQGGPIDQAESFIEAPALEVAAAAHRGAVVRIVVDSNSAPTRFSACWASEAWEALQSQR